MSPASTHAFRSAVLLTAVAVCAVTASGCRGKDDALIPKTAAPLTLRSDDFTADGPIPAACSCDGLNHPPALHWDEGPTGTQSFALTVVDPDAPGGDFTHWVVYDLPASTRDLTANPIAPAFVGKNDFGKPDYGGPCPPSGTHHYVFTLYALDTPALGLSGASGRQAVEHAMKGHVLGAAKLTGAYTRGPG